MVGDSAGADPAIHGCLGGLVGQVGAELVEIHPFDLRLRGLQGGEVRHDEAFELRNLITQFTYDFRELFESKFSLFCLFNFIINHSTGCPALIPCDIVVTEAAVSSGRCSNRLFAPKRLREVPEFFEVKASVEPPLEEVPNFKRLPYLIDISRFTAFNNSLTFLTSLRAVLGILVLGTCLRNVFGENLVK